PPGPGIGMGQARAALAPQGRPGSAGPTAALVEVRQARTGRASQIPARAEARHVTVRWAEPGWPPPG
ncbi:MAG: hypothetical protein ACYDH5_17430, partial [Acidimicrobiales bacterium]